MSYLKYLSLVAVLLPISIQQSFGEEALYTEVTYPFFEDPGPFPGLIILHTSGGWGTVDYVIPRFTEEGYAVYSPDFYAFWVNASDPRANIPQIPTAHRKRSFGSCQSNERRPEN